MTKCSSERSVIMLRLFVLLAAVMWDNTEAATFENSSKDCESARVACVARIVCPMALHSFKQGCRPELQGDRNPGECSMECRRSLISLASDEEGYEVLNCDCGNDSYCDLQRTRMSGCFWNDKSDTVITEETCPQVKKTCEYDQICNESWAYYKQLCKPVDSCSLRCRNMVNVLLVQKNGWDRASCACIEPGVKNCSAELCLDVDTSDAVSTARIHSGWNVALSGLSLVLLTLLDRIISRTA